jgi:hypothetical protein
MLVLIQVYTNPPSWGFEFNISFSWHSQDFLHKLMKNEVNLLECPPEDPHSHALYYYTEPGDHIGYHYDSSFYKVMRPRWPYIKPKGNPFYSINRNKWQLQLSANVRFVQGKNRQKEWATICQSGTWWNRYCRANPLWVLCKIGLLFGQHLWFIINTWQSSLTETNYGTQWLHLGWMRREWCTQWSMLLTKRWWVIITTIIISYAFLLRTIKGFFGRLISNVKDAVGYFGFSSVLKSYFPGVYLSFLDSLILLAFG